MKAQIFINLAVKNLDLSLNFYTQMGFTNNPQFSDATGKCMVFSEEICVMLMTHEKFKTFSSKPIADTKNAIAGLFALLVESLDRVNEIADKAVLAGGIEPIPFKDYGFMQQRTIEDFDGHTWEIFYMDKSKFPQQT
ncbi:MAG: glyoxalase/bleomycin resistance/extradiol dioxygenase family protein [Cytophagales bacterium]|nr:MAG: glyoxalase/bleomycin resistance/extradiol dioxygenase family protein [Cytophagales bacterium]